MKDSNFAYMRPHTTDNLNTLSFLEWCRDYNRTSKYPTTALERFVIGQYQIYQGMEWNKPGDFGKVLFQDSSNKHESFMATAVHMTLLAEQLGLHIENYLPAHLDWIGDSHTPYWDRLLLHTLSRASQMVIYARKNETQRRASRYNPKQLTEDLAAIVHLVIGRIPPNDRSEALFTATKIMTGKL